VMAGAGRRGEEVRGAQVVLWSAGGVGGAETARGLHGWGEAVSRIRRRFQEGGVRGLVTRPKAGRKDHAVPADTVERIVALALSPPPAGRSRWTTRLLAREVHATTGGGPGGRRATGLKRHHWRPTK